ncbi:hypothetical protein RFI_18524 [Reticulomyxa filosa]|uniref:Uncharacterized protein n=1 Tax=Reticulomyxa filosa TaxID=46433 RepID=X6MY10_RETFI|nr:hypothetical protein RFI_18524 [Reticulomyxa filosa]|eukprot:ETO18731.1 hypothetical protein RFI_18524 [Reticulomyxa filosa]
MRIRRKGVTELPKIFGLTASLFKTNENKIERIYHQVNALEAYLDCKIMRVEEHKEELEEIMGKPTIVQMWYVPSVNLPKWGIPSEFTGTEWINKFINSVSRTVDSIGLYGGHCALQLFLRKLNHLSVNSMNFCLFVCFFFLFFFFEVVLRAPVVAESNDESKLNYNFADMQWREAKVGLCVSLLRLSCAVLHTHTYTHTHSFPLPTRLCNFGVRVAQKRDNSAFKDHVMNQKDFFLNMIHKGCFGNRYSMKVEKLITFIRDGLLQNNFVCDEKSEYLMYNNNKPVEFQKAVIFVQERLQCHVLAHILEEEFQGQLKFGVVVGHGTDYFCLLIYSHIIPIYTHICTYIYIYIYVYVIMYTTLQ